ncbi:MAG: hypothetical protein MUE85_21955 [Microscillaceae bacterium]|jgi:hypothetical protein|nr:hypothetical protein [Microscillaceae bacterium]
MTIQGKVQKQNLGTGFWGIIADNGEKWRPVKMPKALQKDGIQVEIEAELANEMVSIFMWGKAIQIKKHKIIG